MKFTLVFLALICIYYSRSAEAQVRHIGGRDVPVIQYPFMAAISYANQHVGNGAIINSKWILTSASAVFFVEEALYYVKVGADSFTSQGFWYEVFHIYRHPEFVGWDYNIALIHLKGNIKYSQTVKPISLPVTDPDFINAKLLSYGQNEHGTRHLREADYTLTADDRCVNFLTDSSARQMIIDQQGYCLFGTDQGQFYSDAGAPVVANEQLYGLFAFAEHHGGINDGSVATRVFRFVTWIQQKIIEKG
ncbi:trypsin-7-like [Anopheles funestus]|uniref:trypsin-7-like n=1 Tax=Anopheles funestus TaxID=62324 RepID=UPI0020C5EDCA|nr:trypsin-7-like [Anopheles funestus]